MFEMEPSKFWWHEADTLLLRTAEVQRRFVDRLDSDPWDHFQQPATREINGIKELTEDMEVRFQEALAHDLMRLTSGLISPEEFEATRQWFDEGIVMVDGVLISWRMLAMINDTRHRRQLRAQLRKMWKGLGTLRAHIKARHEVERQFERRTLPWRAIPYLSSVR